MEIRTIGIDLGKTVFHLVGINGRGAVVVRKKCSRTQLLRFTSNLPLCLIGMEACGGSADHTFRLADNPPITAEEVQFQRASSCITVVSRFIILWFLEPGTCNLGT